MHIGGLDYYGLFVVTMSCSVVHESQCGDGLQLRKMSKSVPLAVISAGDYLGEVEVFNESTRCSAAFAQTDCALLVLSKQHLTEAVPQVILDCLFRYSTFKPHLIATPLNLSTEAAVTHFVYRFAHRAGTGLVRCRMRIGWRNARLQLLLESLSGLHWAPERPGAVLEPEMKVIPWLARESYAPALYI